MSTDQPIHNAAESGDVAAVKCALSAGVHVDVLGYVCDCVYACVTACVACVLLFFERKQSVILFSCDGLV